MCCNGDLISKTIQAIILAHVSCSLYRSKYSQCCCKCTYITCTTPSTRLMCSFVGDLFSHWVQLLTQFSCSVNQFGCWSRWFSSVTDLHEFSFQMLHDSLSDQHICVYTKCIWGIRNKVQFLMCCLFVDSLDTLTMMHILAGTLSLHLIIEIKLHVPQYLCSF